MEPNQPTRFTRLSERKVALASTSDLSNTELIKINKISGVAEVKNKVRRTKRKRLGRTQQVRFYPYIHKVLQQVQPDNTISKRAMEIMNDFLVDIFYKFANQATMLLHGSKRVTLTQREIRSCTKLLLPVELSKHAIGKATTALTVFRNK